MSAASALMEALAAVSVVVDSSSFHMLSILGCLASVDLLTESELDNSGPVLLFWDACMQDLSDLDPAQSDLLS